MPSQPPPSPPVDAELWLARAMRAEQPPGRIEAAQAGLRLPDEQITPDTRVLLLRQVYLGHLELRQLRSAAEVASKMAAVGPLRDVAYHDRSRALYAAGELDEALAAQRLAARAAPASRKSFQMFCLATLQLFGGDPDAALRAVERGLLHAHRDRPLLKALGAYIELSRGALPEGLADTIAELRASPCREGYGQFLLGALAYHIGDEPRAIVHLRTFLERNANVDTPKALTLREELRRARMLLGKLSLD